MKEVAELGHLLVFAFLFCFGAFMAAPVITDVTMEALCPGRDECSIAIYLTGLQQAVRSIHHADAGILSSVSCRMHACVRLVVQLDLPVASHRSLHDFACPLPGSMASCDQLQKLRYKST